jgi:hypothetical protein
MENGQQIDAELQHAACSRTIAAVSVQNLQDVLNAIDNAPPNPKRPTAMLHTAAKIVSDCLNKGLGQIEIDELVPLRPRLKLYLQERRYPYNSVKSYLNYARMLVEEARYFGWVSHRPDVTKEWEKIRQCVWNPKLNAALVVKYAISIGKAPGLFTDQDLKEWCGLAAAQGRSVRCLRDVAAGFRNRIFQAGLDALLPNLSPPRHLGYGTPLSKIPQRLRTQITKLIKWKTAECSKGRNRKGRHRLVTALHFQQFICQFFGYVSKVQRKQALDLRTLFSEKLVYDFVDWCRDERQVRKITLYADSGARRARFRN